MCVLHFLFEFLAKELFFVAGEVEMVSSAIERFESHLVPDTPQHTLADDADTVAEDICFFHGMRGKDHGCFASALDEDVPELSSVLWVKAS